MSRLLAGVDILREKEKRVVKRELNRNRGRLLASRILDWNEKRPMGITKELKQFKSHKEIMWKHTNEGYTGLKSAVNEQSPFFLLAAFPWASFAAAVAAMAMERREQWRTTYGLLMWRQLSWKKTGQTETEEERRTLVNCGNESRRFSFTLGTLDTKFFSYFALHFVNGTP